MNGNLSLGWTRTKVHFINFAEIARGQLFEVDCISKPLIDIELIDITTHRGGVPSIERIAGKPSWKPIVFTFLQSQDPMFAVLVQQQMARQSDFIARDDFLTVDPTYKFEMHVPSWKVKMQGCLLSKVSYKDVSVVSDDCRIVVTVRCDRIQMD